jgi:hypothetical protein
MWNMEGQVHFGSGLPGSTQSKVRRLLRRARFAVRLILPFLQALAALMSIVVSLHTLGVF